MNFVLPVLGGLGLFLYGMTLMGTGLQKVAGAKLKKIIEVLTTNMFMGVILGIIVTMIIQSSGATSVMVIGFVNAGIMSLTQATGVMMGANIGTTITAQLIAFNLTDYAPIAVIIGVGLYIVTSNKKTKEIAEVLIGVGILFIGMGMMGDGLAPLASSAKFTKFMTSLDNPILGMMAGFILTTLVQSSSASIGLLQAFGKQGLININMAFPILFGENIGKTTTGMLSSIGANRNAKKAALINFIFNIIGTILFITLLRGPIESIVVKLSPDNVSRQIANSHTIFNVVNVLVQLPFAKVLVKLANILIPGEDEEDDLVSIYLDNRIIETPSIALGQVNKEVLRMGDLVLKNLRVSKEVLADGKFEWIEEVLEREQLINKLEREITEYLVRLANAPLSDAQHGEANTLLYIINDLERIGDHIDNITELATDMEDGNIVFSDYARDGLYEMFDKCIDIVSKARVAFEFDDKKMAEEIRQMEDEIDALEVSNRKDHIERLNKMDCETEPGIIFLDTLSNLERVSDHSFNIAMYVIGDYK